MVRLRIDGYDEQGPGNLYFAAVHPNPIDAHTLVGRFLMASTCTHHRHSFMDMYGTLVHAHVHPPM